MGIDCSGLPWRDGIEIRQVGRARIAERNRDHHQWVECPLAIDFAVAPEGEEPVAMTFFSRIGEGTTFSRACNPQRAGTDAFTRNIDACDLVGRCHVIGE